MKINQNKKLFRILFVFFISLSLFLLLTFKFDTDYFWHVKAGEYMISHGLLNKDVFSWAFSNNYWMSHEWLFEVIIYLFKCLFGNVHVYVYCFICILFLLLLLFFNNKDNLIKNIPYTLLFIMFFSIILFPFVQARPHMISFCLLSISIYLLFDLYNNEDSKKIYFLPLISLIWANVHGGSSNLIYIFCFLFSVSGLFSFKFKKIEAVRLSNKQFKKYLLIGFLCILVIPFNIHGVRMLIYPYQNMLDSTMLLTITEWQPSNLNEWSHYSYFLFLIFIVFTLLFSDKRINFLHLVLLLFVVYLGLKSIRFWMYTVIVVECFIFYYVKNRKMDKGTISCFYIFIVFFIGAFVLSLTHVNSIKYELNINNNLVTVLKENKPERLYNMYDYGGELIYNDFKVFIDGRADFYSKYNYKDYLNLTYMRSDPEKIINKYNFDYMLVSKKIPLYHYLKNNDNYFKVYKDKDIVLYKVDY